MGKMKPIIKSSCYELVPTELESIEGRSKAQKRCDLSNMILEEIERLDNRYPLKKCSKHKKCVLGIEYEKIIDAKLKYSRTASSYR